MRTPLFQLLRRALRTASQSESQHDSQSKTRETQSDSRRDFIRTAALTGIAASLSPIITACDKPARVLPKGGAPRIAIVGAGIAGLHAAYVLQQAGVRSTLYEASNRVGGRIMTAKNLLVQGAFTELGGELIDSSHGDMLSLAHKFGLELLDLDKPPYAALSETFYFDGKAYTEADVVREIAAILPHLQDEISSISDPDREGTLDARKALDAQSIQSYFGHLGLTGWLRAFLEVAFVTENGAELDEQSALNFLSTVGAEISDDSFAVYGISDERYKIKGGNQQITDRLSHSVADSIHMGHALERIQRLNKTYVLSFRKDNATVDIPADIVLLALPFSVLRTVQMDTPNMPPAISDMIQTLNYGNNGKVVVGFPRPFWHDVQSNGTIYSDLPMQLTWDNTAQQGVEGGGLTFFSGGSMCRVVGSMTKEKAADMLLGHLHTVWPQSESIKPGRIEKMHWPSMNWARGSYSSFAPGQWTKFQGLLSEPVLNSTLYFAGEHCSDHQRGFMNGAAATGRQAAAKILAAMD